MLNIQDTEVLSILWLTWLLGTYFEKKPSINFAENDRVLLLNAIDESSQNSDFKGLLVV